MVILAGVAILKRRESREISPFRRKEKIYIILYSFFNPNWQYFYCWILSLVLFCQYIYLETVYFGSKGICYGNVSIMVYWYFLGIMAQGKFVVSWAIAFDSV